MKSSVSISVKNFNKIDSDTESNCIIGTFKDLLLGALFMTTISIGTCDMALSHTIDEQYTIFKNGNLKKLVSFCARPAIIYETEWELNAKDIEFFEQKLRDVEWLKNENSLFGAGRTLQDWGRQYGGITIDDRKYIFVKFIRKYIINNAKDWRVRPLVVCGGASAQIWLLYDIDSYRLFRTTPRR